MKRCYFCKSESLEEKSVNFDFWWKDKMVMFQNVPALLCSQCGEKYFLPDTSKKMKKLAQKAIRKEIEYEVLTVPLVYF